VCVCTYVCVCVCIDVLGTRVYSHTFHQIIPIFHQQSPAFYPKSPTFYRKSRIFCQKSPMFYQKSPHTFTYSPPSSPPPPHSPSSSAPHAQVQESMQMADSDTHSLSFPPSHYLSLRLCTRTIEHSDDSPPPLLVSPSLSLFLSALDTQAPSSMRMAYSLTHSFSLPLIHCLSPPLTHSLFYYAQVQWSMRMPHSRMSHSRIHSLSFSRLPNLSDYAQMQ